MIVQKKRDKASFFGRLGTEAYSGRQEYSRRLGMEILSDRLVPSRVLGIFRCIGIRLGRRILIGHRVSLIWLRIRLRIPALYISIAPAVPQGDDQRYQKQERRDASIGWRQHDSQHRYQQKKQCNPAGLLFIRPHGLGLRIGSSAVIRIVSHIPSFSACGFPHPVCSHHRLNRKRK